MLGLLLYPYGHEMRSSCKTGVRFGYQGSFAEKDQETGWNAFELRLYDPIIPAGMPPTPKDEYEAAKTLYRGLTSTETDGTAFIFLTESAEVAATYAQKGYAVMQYCVSSFALKVLYHSKLLENLTGSHGAFGALNNEYKLVQLQLSGNTRCLRLRSGN